MIGKRYFRAAVFYAAGVFKRLLRRKILDLIPE
jgi:hypothetical protein